MFENRKIRIAVAGLGGIGGYIGGKLAQFYDRYDNVEVVFITRGEQLKAIKKNGLELISKEIVYHCFPTLASDDPTEIGKIDVFIMAAKSFSVVSILKEYANCITQNTTVLTTQNTVNGRSIIMPHLPKGAQLMEGSIYIASNKVKPGKVEHISGPAKYFFGTEGVFENKGAELEKLLNYAGIDATYTPNITSVLWKKFMFVSPAAIVTALFEITFSEVVESTKSEHLYINLIAELMQLALSKNITIDDNTILANIQLLNNFKGYVKSSFQLDLEQNKRTEVDALVNYVIKEGKRMNVATPHFENALKQLREKYSNLNY